MSESAAAGRRNGIGDLAGLLDELHHTDKLAIGMDRAQHAAVLLHRLDARGVQIDDVEAASRWLAPVLCVTARDRGVLLARLRMRAGPGAAAAPVDLPTLAGERLEEQTRRAVGRSWMVGGVVVLLGAGLLLGGIMAGGGAAPTAGGGTAPGVAAGASGLLGTTGVLMLVLGALFPALYYLHRRRVVPLAAVNPRPSGALLDLLDPGTLQGPLRLTGRQRRAAGRWLDLPETLHRTLRRAGWPTLVRGGRLRTPEHLLLVELDTGADARVLTAYALLDRLHKADLRAAAFAFVGRPDQLRPLGGGRAEALAHVAARFAGARLLLVADGAVFYDTFAAAIASPAELAPFATRILLTPMPAEAWAERERAYDSAGWFVVEQSTEGVAKLALWLAGPREHPLLLPQGAAAPDLPMTLAHEWQVFSERPPSARARLDLIDEVASWLDPDPFAPPHAFEALRVLAMGRLLDPGAVERVLAHLQRLGGAAPDEAGLRRMLRLPWLGRGAMPLWLRDDLVRGMPAHLLAAGRQAWLLHLAGHDPARGVPAGDTTGRLQAEALRRAADGAQFDALSRDLLGLGAARRWLPGRRDLPVMALLLVAGLATGEVLPRLPSLANAVCGAVSACLAVVPPFQAIAFSPATMMAAVAAAFTILWIRPVVLRTALTCVPLTYVLIVAATLLHPGLAMKGNADAGATVVIGLGLLILRAQADRLDPRTLVATPGHPWMNASAVVAALAAVWADVLALGDGPRISDLTALSIVMPFAVGVATGGLAVALAWGRVRDLNSSLPIRAAASAAVASAILTVLDAHQLIPYAPNLNDAYQLAGTATAFGLLTAARRLVRIPWLWLVMIWFGSYAVQLAVLGPWLGRALGPPALYLLLAAPFASGDRTGLRRYGVCLGLALLAYGTLAALPVPESYVDFDVDASLANVSVQWLLLWPVLVALRPSMRIASTGLWWRCLLLVACSVSLMGSPLGSTAAPILLIPLSAWIAARDGPPALPAIALALAPTFVRLPIGSVLAVGGNTGFALAALLVAAFVAKRGFREACLAADRITRWQLAALAVLPLSIDTRLIQTNLWPLSITCAVLIGLSRIPLKPVAWVMCLEIVFGYATNLALRLTGISDTPGGLAHSSLATVPMDIVTVLLALHAARGYARPEFRQLPELRWTWVALVVGLAYIPDVTFLGAEVLPFASTQVLILTLFGAISDRRPAALAISIGGVALPWIVTIVAAAVLIDMLPRLALSPTPFEISLFGRSLLSAISAVTSVWMVHAMGRAMPRLVPSTVKANRRSSPLFASTPVRIGLVLAGLAGVALIASPLVLLTMFTG